MNIIDWIKELLCIKPKPLSVTDEKIINYIDKIIEDSSWKNVRLENYSANTYSIDLTKKDGKNWQTVYMFFYYTCGVYHINFEINKQSLFSSRAEVFNKAVELYNRKLTI